MNILAEFFWRAGTFLLIVAWVLGTGWYLLAVGQEIHANWGRWRTYPVPDKQAMKHVLGYLALIGVNALFLWFALWWFL